MPLPARRVGVFATILLFLLTLAWSVGAGEVMPPAPARYFNDYASLISTATAGRLNTKLEDFEKQTSSQIVVAIFSKMQTDSSLEDYTQRIYHNWKVGQKGTNNGAILFVFVQDRKMRIQTGYGLEGALPDATCKRIIEDELKPRFQKNDFDGGLSAGVDAMLAAARGEYKGSGRTVAQGRSISMPGGRRGTGGSIFCCLIPLVIFIFIVRRASRSGRGTMFRRAGRSSWGFWPLMFTGGGGGGWSSGGGGGSDFGGGGGFSGGGGDSGGGGASGSW